MTDPRLDRVWLLAFGDSRLEKPRRRLRRQAKAFGLKDEQVILLSEKDLDPAFCEKNRAHMVPGSRGYGYWFWKPQICLETLERLPEGDVLLYLDIGCHLRRQGRERFYDYVRIAEEKGFCACQYRSLMSTEEPDELHHYNWVKAFTKGDLLDYFGVRGNTKILEAGQVLSGVVFFRKSEAAIELCRAWRKVYEDDFALIDDSPSRSPDVVPNCRHRHDQSVLCLLWLLKGLPTVSACEIEPSRRWAPAPAPYRKDSRWGHSYFFQMRKYPIWARRDKGLIPLPVRIWRHLWAYYFKPIFTRG